jgi:hypothetical protein
MIDQLDQVLGELTRLHADADRLIDQYIELIRERDELYNIPSPVSGENLTIEEAAKMTVAANNLVKV